ncbi:hypothetical protein P3T36_003317 [Kitasatospora sp. MAP12-15]|nr:hypothetical protein [Kitasatospora sp. MAP12-44]
MDEHLTEDETQDLLEPGDDGRPDWADEDEYEFSPRC